MKTKTPFVLWMALAATLCAASNIAHAAPAATFTDSWKDTAVPDSTVTASTAGTFTFTASLPVDSELTSSEISTDSQFSISIGPVGNTMPIISGTLADAEKFTLGKNGSATFPFTLMNPISGLLTTNGTFKVSWTPTTLTISGSTTVDILGEETNFLMTSDGIAANNTVDMHATNEVDVSLSDTNGGMFDFDTNVTGTLKNTETEYATNSSGGTIPLEAGSLTGAGHGISFSDTWKDTAVAEIQDAASTAGTFSFTASLPVDSELTSSEISTDSQFSINIGPVGNTMPIVSGTLADAEKFTLGKNGSATFPFTLMNPISGLLTTNGSVKVSWTPTTLTITGSATVDIFGEETNFVMSSDGIPADNTLDVAATNEVDVSLSDTNGGMFNYDTNVTGTLRNTETEHTNPNGAAFPLETGSLTGSGHGISFSDTWKDTAAPAAYYASTSGSASLNISLPLEGLLDITNSSLDISEMGTNSQLLITIGPATNPVTVFGGLLGDAKKFTANKNGGTATFSSPTKGTLTLSWTTTSITVTASTIFDLLHEEQTFATNSDTMPGTEPISGYYELGLTLNDTNGGTYSYYNPFVPVTGKNTQTEQGNADGTTIPLETGTITGTADFTPPTVTITSPAAGSKVYNQNSVIELKGTASDKVGVASILFYVNDQTTNAMEIDQEGLPAKSITWSNSVDFSQFGTPGTFVVSVFAIDNVGNQSTPVSRTFQWVQTNSAVVTVNPTGAGTVAGLQTGKQLQLGNSYPVTAKPKNTNWIFSQWTDGAGDVLSSSATYDYIDTDGALTANFVPNPFTNGILAGTYTGLYYDTNNGPQVRNAGYITLTVTKTGAFSGTLYNADYGKSRSALTGQLSVAPDGSSAAATLPVIQLGKNAFLQVILQVATDPVLTDPGAGLLTGFVNALSSATDTNNPYTAEIQGELSLYNTNTLAGLYNVVISPETNDPSQGPAGYSYGSATVSSKRGSAGAVALVLNLADGTSPTISFPTALAQDGTCPVYASLYGGNGVILGWMQFAMDGSGSMSSASIYWLTAYDYTSSTWPDGFSGQPAISGALYTPPKAGTNLFGATDLILAIDPGFSGLSLQDETDVSVTYNPAKNTFTDTNKVSITLTAATGALTGTFSPPGSRSALTFHGVEAGGAAYGFYTGANKQTGPISLNAVQVDPVGGGVVTSFTLMTNGPEIAPDAATAVRR